MMRLINSNFSFSQILDECCVGITGNNSLRSRLVAGKAVLDIEGNNYVTLAIAGTLHTIASVGVGDPVVIANLKKSELVNLYETYFRDKDKPARAIYDVLLVSAKEKCPFCGGIGRPRNLDHYLPKAHFPQFSVLPKNLIPSCRDCNMDGKGQGFAASADKQIIHPFLDHADFFNEQWIFARYTPSSTGQNDPGVVEYFVRPPVNWTNINKQRVENHFIDFDIAVRYSKEAASELIYVEPDCNNVNLSVIGLSQLKADWQLIVNRAPFINHWKRVMYLALLDAF